MASEPKQIINCHTHVFTGDHVPPWLAKTFLVWPLYYLIPLSGFVKVFRWWYNGPGDWKYKPWYKKIARTLSSIKAFLSKNFILTGLKFIVKILLTIHSFFIIYDWVNSLLSSKAITWVKWIESIRQWLRDKNILWDIPVLLWQILIVLLVLVFIPSGRNFILFVANKLWNFLGKLPGKHTKELIKRYLTIGRHAFHKEQSDTFARLRKQYPPGSGFVVLPMDMEYMNAGKLKKENRYRQQMADLVSIKNSHPGWIFPFVFVDPRRIGPVTKENNYQPGDKEYFNYTIHTDPHGKKTVLLSDCFIKELIERHQFSGFKIYPALGYYPFDEKLLPLWKYAVDNNLPVLTHCIRGTIFYRGIKNRDWYQHPVFEEFAWKDNNKQDVFKPLLLPQRKNIDFSVNFTHPLNYLCLLEETLLRELIGRSKDKKLKDLFGFKDKDTKLSSDLSELKLCFGHFGGEDEWKRFFEKDRDNFSPKIVELPEQGLDMLNDSNGVRSKTKTEQVWKGADWYTIICSLMLQKPNVYADISYILHDPAITPLLKQTLKNNKLRKKVLFGTDFYVVRNHNSDKELLAGMMAGLDTEEFDQIAKKNPAKFLNLSE
ncbi:MAG TPA: amidohydrolase family protein [Chitinophagaceae bacterium]|nr:amidohydrolase family protein [Chitinophagaceae bacterium]